MPESLAGSLRSGLLALLLFSSFCASGCVSARMSDREPDRLFRQSKYLEAAEYLQSRIQNGPGKPGSADELLYLLDTGLALHQAGEAEASNAYFALAEKHVGLNQFTSISEETGTLVTGENTKAYRGEDFEKVLIHVYKAMNYAILGGFEDALVEARLVNRKLEQLRREGEKPYKQNAFARYLSAVLYEAEGELNDAYVDYKKVYEIEPGFREVGRDLWRIAAWLGLREDMDRWKSEFQLSGDDTDRARNLVLNKRSGRGELIIVFQNGLSPIKVADPAFPSMPRFVPRLNPVREAEVLVDGSVVGRTIKLHDIEQTAIENLEEKKLALAAKRIAGRLTKAVLAEQVRKRTNNDALAFLTELVLVATDQADTRSWSLLPRDLQILRVNVDPGVHELQVVPVGAAALPSRSVRVEAGKKVLLSVRYLP